MRNKPNREELPTQPSSPSPIEIKSLDQLRQLHHPLAVDIELEPTGQKIRIPIRRLTPAEESKIDEMLMSLMPPMIPGKTPEDDRPNLNDETYLKKKAKAEVEARCLSLYWAVPIFASSSPLIDVKAIVDHVQEAASKANLSGAMLNALWSGVRNGGVRTADLVNFTSTSS
jgi:hypothetical protein